MIEKVTFFKKLNIGKIVYLLHDILTWYDGVHKVGSVQLALSNTEHFQISGHDAESTVCILPVLVVVISVVQT